MLAAVKTQCDRWAKMKSSQPHRRRHCAAPSVRRPAVPAPLRLNRSPPKTTRRLRLSPSKKRAPKSRARWAPAWPHSPASVRTMRSAPRVSTRKPMPRCRNRSKRIARSRRASAALPSAKWPGSAANGRPLSRSWSRARHEAEQQAAAERKKAQGQNQGGLLGAIGSAAQSLFDKAKQAVQSVFDLARQLVRSAIERAQQLATAVMERARQAIVGAIRMAGAVLTAIGDRVLIAFPALHARFRKAIQDRIAAAEATVNRLASALKHAVQTALNLLGTALSAAIGLLHQGMQAALEGEIGRAS